MRRFCASFCLNKGHTRPIICIKRYSNSSYSRLQQYFHVFLLRTVQMINIWERSVQQRAQSMTPGRQKQSTNLRDTTTSHNSQIQNLWIAYYLHLNTYYRRPFFTSFEAIMAAIIYVKQTFLIQMYSRFLELLFHYQYLNAARWSLRIFGWSIQLFNFIHLFLWGLKLFSTTKVILRLGKWGKGPEPLVK